MHQITDPDIFGEKLLKNKNLIVTMRARNLRFKHSFVLL